MATLVLQLLKTNPSMQLARALPRDTVQDLAGGTGGGSVGLVSRLVCGGMGR